MKHRVIRETAAHHTHGFPDCAAFHPGYRDLRYFFSGGSSANIIKIVRWNPEKLSSETR
jgi:hypothetical protein